MKEVQKKSHRLLINNLRLTSQIQEEPHMDEREEAQEQQEKEKRVINIVVAVDASEESMHACEWACRNLLSAQTNIRQAYNFLLLHVQSPVCVSFGPAYILSNEVVNLLQNNELRTTQKILKRAKAICNRYNVKARSYVVIGKPKEKICEAAHKLGAHFLVMGSHGHAPLIRAIKGSVSAECSRNAMCPVVVVNKKLLQN